MGSNKKIFGLYPGNSTPISIIRLDRIRECSLCAAARLRGRGCVSNARVPNLNLLLKGFDFAGIRLSCFRCGIPLCYRRISPKAKEWTTSKRRSLDKQPVGPPISAKIKIDYSALSG